MKIDWSYCVSLFLSIYQGKIKAKKRKPDPKLEDVKELIHGPPEKKKKSRISFAVEEDDVKVNRFLKAKFFYN